MTCELTAQGRFIVGANYWASHAGTAMWSDWRPDIVEEDLKKLSDAGLRILRVFPLWRDFQPLTRLYALYGEAVEFRHGEQPLPFDEAGRAGVSAEAMERFSTFADLSQKHGLKLIVALLTGWMSGRLFVPPAFDGLNVITDPTAVMWQVRFVRHFVRRFKRHPAVAAWDLGNECNCMGKVPSREAAWCWTSAIAGAVRMEDSNRPVVSGMHGLSPGPDAAWSIQDQAELTDLLTTHPYPCFTPHCARDPINTMRACLHGAAESCFYADIGGKPCLVEEIGSLGPMIAGEDIAADFARTALFSLWAHDCHGLLWWCANDQTNLEHAPYDWCQMEQELGLLRQDGAAKPALKELGRFRSFLDSLPFDALPPRLREGCCILSNGQDNWGVAYSSFVLAKQAGFDLTFQYHDQPLKDAPLYLLPCVKGMSAISRRTWLELLDRARRGATLYVSLDGGFLAHFEEATGVRIQTRAERRKSFQATMKSLRGAPKLNLELDVEYLVKPTRAETLGVGPDDNPVFTRADYGSGKVYFLSCPLEIMLARTSGAFSEKRADPYWSVYACAAQDATRMRAAQKQSASVGITEHPLAEGRRLIVLINYAPDDRNEQLTLGNGWSATEFLYGAEPRKKGEGYVCPLKANDAAVFLAERSDRA